MPCSIHGTGTEMARLHDWIVMMGTHPSIQTRMRSGTMESIRTATAETTIRTGTGSSWPEIVTTKTLPFIQQRLRSGMTDSIRTVTVMMTIKTKTASSWQTTVMMSLQR